jgi:hypothetical protein
VSRRSAPLRLAVALCGIALLLVGCSSIPSDTEPQPLNLGSGASVATSVPQPSKDTKPLDIVRGFISASADPSNKHAAARAYLAPAIHSTWDDTGSVMIIANTFNTGFLPQDSRDPNTDTVQVNAQMVGALGADDAFTAASSSNTSFNESFRLARQPDGEWRISYAPDGVLMTQEAFATAYKGIRVYFFDANYGALVPDLRYVAAEPRAGLPARVIDELLAGPSNSLSGAVVSAIPSGVQTSTNPYESPDGALVVNLAKLPDQQYHNKQLIIAQIVKSLQPVFSNPVQVESAGAALITSQPEWRLAELPYYNLATTPNGALPGLVVTQGRVTSLKDGSPVAGSAGTGADHVLTAAQSIDGSELALVCQNGSSQQLRIGDYGKEDAVANVPASTFTRPTWMPGELGNPSNEVWTVADGQVVRVLKSSQQATWYAAPVDASELTAFGPITDLRLSRDGTRVAALVGGHLLVGAVVDTPNTSTVSIKQVVQLQAGQLTGVIGVDWLDQDTLVVATTQPQLPVASVSVDGLTMIKYNSSNLTPPIKAITAADGRPVVVADPIGLWQSNDTDEVWQPESHQTTDSIPLFPG